MIPVNVAEELILKLVQPFNSECDMEQVDLFDALGRILAVDVVSDLDFPHFSNSAMDGYAFRHRDLEKFTELAIAPLDIPAGSSTPQSLEPGQCARILTGGMIPVGADTVVMQEDVDKISKENYIKFKSIPKLGEYVRDRGAFYQAGSPLVQAGSKLTSTEIGAIAAAHCPQVSVYRQPKVAILSTGSELVDLDSKYPLQPGQIVDSNQYALAVLVRQVGAIALPMGIVPDRKAALSAAMIDAIASADIVISSGGVSVGDYDYVEMLLAEIGATIHIHAVAIKPGKPLTVATVSGDQQTLYFGVPGNPVSAMVSFWRFIAGAIAKLSGAHSSFWQPQFVSAIATEDLHAQGKRETYLWGNLTWQGDRYTFQPVDNFSSGNLISMIGTNSLAVLRVNQTYVPEGDRVQVMVIP
jgi:molybdopterin molybdotransferase